MLHYVGNETKGRISKRVFQESKARQIVQKTNISYPQIRTCTCQIMMELFLRKSIDWFSFSPFLLGAN